MWALSGIMIFIVWSWQLTPTWVNVVCTVLAGLQIFDEIWGGD